MTLKAQAVPDRGGQAGSGEQTEIDLGGWEVTGELVREYTLAVGDSLPLYSDCHAVPPLALTAWALGRLLNHLDLPPGAIHGQQEMDSLREVKFGERVRPCAEIGKPRQRAGMQFITASFSIFPEEPGKDILGGLSPALTGKATVPGSVR